jgi:membrane dipeptidase
MSEDMIGNMRGNAMDRRRFVALTGVGGAALLTGEAAGTPRTRDASPAAGPIIVGSAWLDVAARGRGEARATLDAARRGGVAALVVPAIGGEHLDDAMRALLRFRRLAAELPDVCEIVERPEQLAGARQGRVALVPSASGFQWAARDLARLVEFRAGGLRVTRLSSGWRNLAADGSFEASDLALTHFGRAAVPALNQVRLVIDLVGTGRKSSLEAMRLTRAPVIFSSANAAALHPHPLNLTDDQIRACASTGGVVCLSAFPPLLASGSPTADDAMRHLDHLVKVAGVEHVALGLDFGARHVRRYATDPLPDAPVQFPATLSTLHELPAFAGQLRGRGYDAAAQARILGGNLQRVFQRVWSAG